MKQPGRKPFPVPSDLAGVLAWHRRQVATAGARAARYRKPGKVPGLADGASWRASQVRTAECQERLHAACARVIEAAIARAGSTRP